MESIRAAVEAAEFDRARALIAAFEGPVSADVLELEGRAAYGAGALEAALDAYERLHRLHLDERRPHDAAMAAVMVGMYLMMDTGLMAPVRAWLGRAERLLEDAPDHPVRAWICAVRTYERFMCGDMPGAGGAAREALDRGTRHGLVPPCIIGRTALARVRIHDGHVDEGLRMLDDVALELLAGTLDPLTTGQMWCEVICAMQWIGHHDRAEEWTAAMERWRHGAAFGGLNGRCRVHRAEILRMRGPCDEAEQEALLACEELRPWMRREYGWPLTELGNVRLRKGDLAGAEEAFLAAHQNAWSPQPGLSLLRLAQGKVDEALSLVSTALEHPFDIPSKERPPSGGLRRAPLLGARVRIAIAAGDVETARADATELASVAEQYKGRTLENAALEARGRVALADGRYRDAIRDLGAAVSEWAAQRMPFEAATLRAELADALRGAGDPAGAALETTAACRAFEQMGAGRWVALVRNRPPRMAEEDPHASAPRYVFRCEGGDMRTVTFAGTTARLKDLKGMRYLERLLAEPHREFHALDVVSVERGALPIGKYVDADLVLTGNPSTGLEVFDSVARDAYRRRLEEVEADIAEAEAHNDLERARLARADRQFLIDELARGVGLDGRARTVGDGSERARTSATRTIRYALDRIAEHHPAVAEHFERTVRTGTYFVYEPDPLARVRWET